MDISGIEDIQSFGALVGKMGDELRGDSRDQFTPEEVLSFLGDLCLDTGIARLPGALGALRIEALKRRKDSTRGKEVANFGKPGILRNVDDTIFALFKTDIERRFGALLSTTP